MDSSTPKISPFDHDGDRLPFRGFLGIGGRRIKGIQVVSWVAFSLSYLLVLNAFWEDFFLALGLVVIMVPGYVLLTEGLRFSYRRIKIQRRLESRILIIVLCACMVAGVLQLLLSFAALEILVKTSADDVVPHKRGSRLIFHFMIFFGWSLAHLWQKSEREVRVEAERRREALAAAERAELQMLRFQLNPHFLFNSLNGIITEIQDRPPVALEMTHRLAEYLRHTLEHRGELLVPLRHEVGGARDYLEIELDRFGELLEVSFDLPDELKDIQVPSFLLQPLVENAIKYGRRNQGAPLQVKLEIVAEGESLKIFVRNQGSLADQKSPELDRQGTPVSSGVGLDVLRRRLALHYPERHEFSLSQEGEFVCASITLTGNPC